MFKPVARQKLYLDVVSQLLEHIRGGRFAPGADLPSERDLAALLGVGRVAVREALHSLQERGVIAIRHGRRAQVLEPSSALLAPRIAEAAEHVLASFGESRDEVLEARVLFETAMARLAAERASEAGLAGLRAALARNRAAVPEDLEYLESDLALHRAIAALSGNALFIAISDGMLGWLRRYRVDMVRVEGANRISHREHARIVGRIVARDATGAARAMAEHLERSNALYRKLGEARRTRQARQARRRRLTPALAARAA
jgi:DNA-binding FadR family transcriptional regulator